jgi:putative adenylate-forming enzyme
VPGNLLTIPRVIWKRRALERSCGWTPTQLRERQAAALADLRQFALERSPFYKQFHKGLEHAPLAELPVLSKRALMENFDDLVTDRAVRLTDAEAFLASRPGARLFRGRYVVLSTSGSTGFRGIFLFDRGEWLTALAGITRPMLWAGAAPNPLKPSRTAMIASTGGSHYSSRVGLSLASRFMPALRLDAGEPIDRIVARLNDFQPQVMVAYPSILRQLTAEQADGRLRIRPRKIATSAEALAEDVRRRVRDVWGLRVYDTYGCTEYSPIAAECELGRKHLFEDGAVIEIERDRVLLTVLSRRTQPLIRYEISDMVTAVEGECACGRPFRMIETVEGRMEEVLVFGTVSVHPNRFHEVLETVAASGWQVIRENGGLSVLLTGLSDAAACDGIGRSVREMLEAVGAPAPPIRVSAVNELRRGATGKAPLVVA